MNKPVFIMMYAIRDYVNWWGVYDSEELAWDDGGNCYQNCTGIDFGEKNKEYSENIASLLNAKGYFKDAHIYIWIDEATLCTKDNISSL